MDKILVPKKIIVIINKKDKKVSGIIDYNENRKFKYKGIPLTDKYKFSAKKYNYKIIDNTPRKFEIVGTFSIIGSSFSNKSHFLIKDIENDYVFAITVENMFYAIQHSNINNMIFTENFVLKPTPNYAELVHEKEYEYYTEANKSLNNFEEIDGKLKTGDVLELQYKKKKPEYYVFFKKLYIIDIKFDDENKKIEYEYKTKNNIFLKYFNEYNSISTFFYYEYDKILNKKRTCKYSIIKTLSKTKILNDFKKELEDIHVGYAVLCFLSEPKFPIELKFRPNYYTSTKYKIYLFNEKNYKVEYIFD